MTATHRGIAVTDDMPLGWSMADDAAWIERLIESGAGQRWNDTEQMVAQALISCARRPINGPQQFAAAVACLLAAASMPMNGGEL
jgi:hypothetical protein